MSSIPFLTPWCCAGVGIEWHPQSAARWSLFGLISLAGQPYQLSVFLGLAGSELIGWSIRKKSGTASSYFAVAMLLPQAMLCAATGTPC